MALTCFLQQSILDYLDADNKCLGTKRLQMELNLYALKTFKEVVDQQSFSKAASTLFLTQPAVSLQIQSLESYFQVPLLIRGHAGEIATTEEGRVVYNYALKLEQLRQELFQSMSRSGNRLLITLRLGTCFIAGEYLFPEILKSLQAKYPDTRVALSVLKCERIFQGILSGIFDLGITGVPPKHKALTCSEIGRVPLILFQSPQDQEKPGTASIRNLLHKPVILREKGSGIHKEFSDFLKDQRLSLKHFQHVYFSESNQAMKSMVRAGMGFSMMPSFMIQEELRTGEFVPITLEEGELQQGFYLVYRKQEELPEALDLLVGFITREIKKNLESAPTFLANSEP